MIDAFPEIPQHPVQAQLYRGMCNALSHRERERDTMIQAVGIAQLSCQNMIEASQY